MWLINTGWTGGDYPQRLSHAPASYPRDGLLALTNPEVSFHQDSVFGLSVPDEIPGVPSDLLYPARTWDDKKKFSEVSQDLKRKFEDNFKRFDGEGLALEAGAKVF